MRVLSASERIEAAPAAGRPHRHNGSARKLAAHGVSMTAWQWHLATGIPVTTLFYRIAAGWDPEDCVNPHPTRKPGRAVLHYVEVDGERLTLRQLAVRCGVSYAAMVKRRLKGDSPERIAGRYRYSATYERNGETLTIGEWAERAGLGADVLRYRLSAGWTLEEAMQTPLYTRRGKHAAEEATQ